MGDVVNLQQYRKKLKRQASARRAASQRGRDGQSRNERRQSETTRRRHERDMEGKRLERTKDEEGPPPSA